MKNKTKIEITQTLLWMLERLTEKSKKEYEEKKTDSTYSRIIIHINVSCIVHTYVLAAEHKSQYEEEHNNIFQFQHY